MTTRRSFLAGLLASAVAPALPPGEEMDLNEAALENMMIQLQDRTLFVFGARHTILWSNVEKAWLDAWEDGKLNHGFNAGGDGVALLSRAHPNT